MASSLQNASDAASDPGSGTSLSRIISSWFAGSAPVAPPPAARAAAAVFSSEEKAATETTEPPLDPTAVTLVPYREPAASGFGGAGAAAGAASAASEVLGTSSAFAAITRAPAEYPSLEVPKEDALQSYELCRTAMRLLCPELPKDFPSCSEESSEAEVQKAAAEAAFAINAVRLLRLFHSAGFLKAEVVGAGSPLLPYNSYPLENWSIKQMRNLLLDIKKCSYKPWENCKALVVKPPIDALPVNLEWFCPKLDTLTVVGTPMPLLPLDMPFVITLRLRNASVKEIPESIPPSVKHFALSTEQTFSLDALSTLLRSRSLQTVVIQADGGLSSAFAFRDSSVTNLTLGVLDDFTVLTAGPPPSSLNCLTLATKDGVRHRREALPEAWRNVELVYMNDVPI